MLAPPEAEDRVTPGIGWPLDVTVDPRIGWPNVPRETLDWPTKASAEPPYSGPAPTATASHVIEIPPGPRRARFDEDEFGSPAVEEDRHRGSRRASCAGAPPGPRRRESKGRRRQDHDQRQPGGRTRARRAFGTRGGPRSSGKCDNCAGSRSSTRHARDVRGADVGRCARRSRRRLPRGA